MTDTRMHPPYISLADAVASHARWLPHKTALVGGDRRVGWREFNEQVNRVANGLLQRGLHKGDKVATVLGNCVEMVEIMLGTIRAGGVIVPLSPMLTPDSLAAIIADSDARFLFMAQNLDPGPFRSGFLERLVVVGDSGPEWTSYRSWTESSSSDDLHIRLTQDDEFNIIYSSGTTGVPKGILHTHSARQQFALMLALEFRFDPTAVAIITTPLYSNGTWIMLLPAITLGATSVIMERFDPVSFLDLVARERGTHTFMVPPQYSAILNVPRLSQFDTTTLRIMLSAGAPMERSTKERVLRSFGGRLFELYGLTEGIATTLKPDDPGEKLGSVGTPTFGSDIRIIDGAGNELPRGAVGEIVGYGSALMREYYKRPDATREAIWRDEAGREYLRTGDIGRLDADGYLYLLDRKKDMIVSGGFNVFPSDIESVFREHPDVQDVAVIGVPSERWGETPLALVVPRPGANSGERDLATWVNARVAAYQRVSGVEFRDEIPRVPPLGKVPKRELRAPYWRDRD